MAVTARREGPIDYLLAAASGAATGAVKGIEARQQREAREAQAAREAETDRIKLSLQAQGIDIQRLMQESLAQNRLDILKLQQETTPDIATQEKFLRLKKEKPTPTDLDIEEQEAVIKGKKTANRRAVQEELAFEQNQINEDRKITVTEKKFALAEDEFNYAKLKDYSDAVTAIAAARYDFETGIYMKELSVNMDRASGSLTNDDKTYLKIVLDSVNLAMEKPSEFRLRNADFNLRQASKLLGKHGYAIKATLPKFVEDTPWWDPLSIRKHEMKLEDLPPESSIPIPLKKPARPPAEPLVKPTLDPLNRILEQRPGAPDVMTVFDELDSAIATLGRRKTKPTPTARPSKGLSETGQSIVDDLIAAGKTTISKELRQGLIDAGLSKADVDKIEESIKKGK